MAAWCGTWRFRVVGEDHWERSQRGDQAAIYLMWHEAILPLLWQRRGLGITIVVSAARDGQYLSDFARRLGYETAEGSSTRGGVRALVGAIRVLRAHGAVAFTPDGPRGPRRQLKPGFLAAAQRTGALVFPMHASARWARRLDSWDRFLLPYPGARVDVVVGQPFEVAPGPEGAATGLQCAEAALAAVVREAEWRSGVATGTG
jgi:lysophospholipid acyltransferase (LPLAT)-like uncharacterized protein